MRGGYFSLQGLFKWRGYSGRAPGSVLQDGATFSWLFLTFFSLPGKLLVRAGLPSARSNRNKNLGDFPANFHLAKHPKWCVFLLLNHYIFRSGVVVWTARLPREVESWKRHPSSWHKATHVLHWSTRRRDATERPLYPPLSEAASRLQFSVPSRQLHCLKIKVFSNTPIFKLLF